MRAERPKISVGMPVYNGERYLEAAILAVLGQTCGDFELIISDNASTDRTPEICRDFAARDPRICYLRNPVNIGAANNYNQLFHRSSAPYFRWFNADDLCAPELHEQCLAALEAHPDAVMAYGKTDIVDGEGALLKHYDDRLDLRQDSVAERFISFQENVGLTNAIYGLMRRSALQKTSLMGNGSFPAADTIMMAELVLQGKFIELPQTLFFRRMHEQASSWDRKNQTVQQLFWTGKNSKFVMPTFKRQCALLWAIAAAPCGWHEKWRMRTYVLRRMLWSRQIIGRELLQEIGARVGKKSSAPS